MTIKLKRGVRYFQGEGAQVSHMKAKSFEAPQTLTHRQKLSNGWVRDHFKRTKG